MANRWWNNENSDRLYFGGSKITEDGDCSHEIKRCLLLGRKPITNPVQFSSVQSLSHVRLFVTPWIAACQASLSITNSRSSLKLTSIELVMPSRQHIKKQGHYFADKGLSSQSYGFSSSHVWVWELDYKESWVPKNWCFWTGVLEKTLESPLDCKEIQPVHLKGDQSWIFVGRTDAEADTPILWPSDEKDWLIGKDPDAGKDWRQEEEGMHHWLNGHDFEQVLGVGDGQGCLVCCSPCSCKESDTTEWLNRTGLGSLPFPGEGGLLTVVSGPCFISTSSLLGSPRIWVTIWCFALLDSILRVYTFPSESWRGEGSLAPLI